MHRKSLSLAAFVAIFATSLSSAPMAAPAPRSLHSGTVNGQLLTLNDFHGNLISTRTATIDGVETPVGGAATLAAMFRRYRAENPNTLVVNAGDMAGGSPPLTALFQDEPTVEFLNMAGVDVGTLGNHEFDEGVAEMRRLWEGGPHPASRYYPRPFPGAKFPVVCSNVVDARTGEPLMAPYVVKKVGGVRVGLIGAVTAEMPQAVAAAGLVGTRLIEPHKAINRWVAHLKKYGVRSIIVLLHEGGVQTPQEPGGALTGAVLDVAKALDPEVDIVVSAHTHQYHNTFVNRMLVIQARSHGEAIGKVDFVIDRGSADMIRKRGRVVPAVQKDVTPAADVAAMVAAYEQRAAPRINKVVAQSAQAMPLGQRNEENMIGCLIADAQRDAMKADIAIMNPGGIRAGLPAGPVTWGQVYSVQPFGNRLVMLRMTGAGVREALEQQWGPEQGGAERFYWLHVSGLRARWDASAPLGRRIVSLTDSDGKPMDPQRTYTVVMNSFLADGGDGFTAFSDVKDRVNGPNDLDALIAYMASNPNVVPATDRTGPVR